MTDLFLLLSTELHGLSGMVRFKGQSTDVTSSMAAVIALVSSHRYSCALVGEVLVVCQVVVTGEVGIWNPSPNAPAVYFSIHKCVQDQLGSTSAGPYGSRDVVREGTQISISKSWEMKTVRLSLAAFNDRIMGRGVLVVGSYPAHPFAFHRSRRKATKLMDPRNYLYNIGRIMFLLLVFSRVILAG